MDKRVLVVDDNDDVRELLIHILQGEGFAASGVADGATALAFLNESAIANPFDLVLLDVMMPGISGVELIPKIRAISSLSATLPIVMVSALGSEEEVQIAIDAGASAYLLKPFRREDIKQVTAKIFNDNNQPSSEGVQP